MNASRCQRRRAAPLARRAIRARARRRGSRTRASCSRSSAGRGAAGAERCAPSPRGDEAARRAERDASEREPGERALERRVAGEPAPQRREQQRQPGARAPQRRRASSGRRSHLRMRASDAPVAQHDAVVRDERDRQRRRACPRSASSISTPSPVGLPAEHLAAEVGDRGEQRLEQRAEAGVAARRRQQRLRARRPRRRASGRKWSRKPSAPPAQPAANCSTKAALRHARKRSTGRSCRAARPARARTRRSAPRAAPVCPRPRTCARPRSTRAARRGSSPPAARASLRGKKRSSADQAISAGRSKERSALGRRERVACGSTPATTPQHVLADLAALEHRQHVAVGRVGAGSARATSSPNATGSRRSARKRSGA